MNDHERARKLHEDSRKYYLMDTRWRDNYRARMHRLARKYDARNPETDAVIVMFLDVAGNRIDVRPRWRSES